MHRVTPPILDLLECTEQVKNICWGVTIIVSSVQYNLSPLTAVLRFLIRVI